MLVLPDTVISAEVVPVAVLVCDTVLLSPVMFIVLVWLAPAPKSCVVVLLSPAMVVVIHYHHNQPTVWFHS